MNKLLNMVSIIKKECLRCESCDVCPLYDDDPQSEYSCIAAAEMPEDWKTEGLAVESHDTVKHPSHYCKNGLECIDVIKAEMTPEQYKGYLYGNVLKYMWRWQDKNGLEDLKKAGQYLEWLQEEAGK